MYDEASIRNIPGARLIHRGDFTGVVAETEWDAVRAARQLKVTWETTPTLPGSAALYESMRNAKTTDQVVMERGDIGAFPETPRTLSQEPLITVLTRYLYAVRAESVRDCRYNEKPIPCW